MPKKMSPFAVIKKAVNQSDDVLSTYQNMSVEDQSKVMTMVASHLGDYGQWEAVSKLLHESGVTPETVNTLEQGIVLINSLLNQTPVQADEALQVFKKLHKTGHVRKKHLALISAYFRDQMNWSMSHQLFMDYHKDYVLDSSDLDWVFHPEVPDAYRNDVLSYFSSIHSHVVTKDARSIMDADTLPLIKIPFSDKQSQQVMSKLPIPKEQLSLRVQDDDQLIVVDAANVMYYNHQDTSKGIQSRSYFQLDNLVTLLQETYPEKYVVLVLHERHFKLNKYEKWSKSDRERVARVINEWYSNTRTCVYKTPYGQNDDHYSIYIAVKFNCPLVTNDQFLDHINKIPLLKVWRSEMIIEYDITPGNAEPVLLPGLPFSHRHQSDDENYYVPTEDPQDWKVVRK